MLKNEILRIYGKNPHEMTRKLLDHIDLKQMILQKAQQLHKPVDQMRIALKPNLISCTPAEFGATTHPEIPDAIIAYLSDHALPLPLIMEGSWVGDQTPEAFEYCGYNVLAAKWQLSLIDLQQDTSSPVDCGGMEIQICDQALQVDFLINLPVLKGHCQTKVTCALKNLKGLLPNKEKRRFHTLGLHKPIAHLNAGIHPDLIITDHICGDPDFEEGGHPLIRNCIMASLDPVLTDAFAAQLLGYRPQDIGYIPLAAALGVGSMDLGQLKLTTLEGESTEALPESRKLLQVSYAVEEIDSCSACYGILISALSRLRQEQLLDRLPCRIGIGQGYRQKSGPFGIGNCTRHFEQFVPGCPPDEEAVYQAIKKWILQNQSTADS